MTGGDASAAAKSLIKVLFFIRRSSRISGGFSLTHRAERSAIFRGASCYDRTIANDNVLLSYLIQHRTSCPRCRLLAPQELRFHRFTNRQPQHTINPIALSKYPEAHAPCSM